MEVISGRFRSTLNPYAAPYVPTAYRSVEDFSDEWWGLVKSAPWFRDYWLRECYEDPETDLDLLDICDPAVEDADSLFHSYPSQEEKEMKEGKLELAKLGAERWRGPREMMVGPRYCGKAPKFVNLKMGPRVIQQPR